MVREPLPKSVKSIHFYNTLHLTADRKVPSYFATGGFLVLNITSLLVYLFTIMPWFSYAEYYFVYCLANNDSGYISCTEHCYFTLDPHSLVNISLFTYCHNSYDCDYILPSSRPTNERLETVQIIPTHPRA